MTILYEEAKQMLEQHGQAQVIRFWDRLNPDQQAGLLRQIETLNFDIIRQMHDLLRGQDDTPRSEIAPADVADIGEEAARKAREAGEQALRAGQVGAILVAGGQGTRLGFNGPKGCFGIGPVTNASLFEIHARKILAKERRFEASIPFYIMTSRENDTVTREFFKQNKCFGLAPDRVRFFVQGMWPALNADGKIVLDAPDHIFLSPDGHGGILAALRDNGMLDDMAKRGLQTLFYFQVDNPLVEIADPLFVGLHRLNDAEMSVKVCDKTDPEERVGVVVKRDDRNTVVEYTELTREEKYAQEPDGRLLYRLGSVAIHMFSLDFLQRESCALLPLHVAHKKVPYCTDTGKTVLSDLPNAYKFEKFVFDALPRARRSLNVEFARKEEFSPVKNGTGTDSPETARRDMTRKFARWLEACGVAVPKTKTGDIRCKIEIDPCLAYDVETLRPKLGKNFRIKGDVLLK